MPGAPHPHLHHAVLSVLAAENFSRTSSTALHTATDVLSRYMALLARTCAEQAQNAGRSGVNYYDVEAALEEMGTDLEVLKEWAETTGRVPIRPPALEKEIMEEWDAHLSEGLSHDPSDRIPLVYGIAPSPEPTVASPSSSERSISRTPSPKPPDLPLSPMSMSPPGSPSRKRARPSSWDPPDYIPSFLPPFPGDDAPQEEPNPLEDELLPLMPLSISQPAASFHAPTPYATSTVHDLPRSHLPSSPAHTPPASPRTTPAALISAARALQNDTVISAPSTHPARHRVAERVTYLSSSRYGPPPTLFAASEPPLPRHPAPAPTHPVHSTFGSALPLPPPATRPVATPPPLSAAPPYLFSMFPQLTESFLSAPLYNRVERLQPPPILHHDDQFLYGRPYKAFWNAPSPAAPGDKEAKVADANLRATWDWTPKDFREGLPVKKARVPSGFFVPRRNDHDEPSQSR